MNATAENGMVQMSVRLPADLARALERVAAENDRTVSAELRRIIRFRCLEQGALPIRPGAST